MSRLTAYYDRYAQRWRFSLNSAIAYTAVYAFILFLGFHALLTHTRDPFRFYACPLFLVLGTAGVFHGIQVIRAVRRRTGESQSAN